MVAAGFVVSEDSVAGWPGLGVFSRVAGGVLRRLGAADEPVVQAVVSSGYDAVAEFARLVECSGDMLAVAQEERLAYLERNGYGPSEVEATFALVESWLNGENRRAIRDFGACADDPGLDFRSSFREWFSGQPVDDLVLGVLSAGVRDPGLALAYAVSELCDEVRAARNLALVRRQVPDWSEMPGAPDDGIDGRLDQAYSRVEAETWPTY